MIIEWIITKALDLSFEKANQFLTEGAIRLAATKRDLEAALASQQQAVQRWCEEISFSDLKQPKVTEEVYVGLDVFVYPRSLKLEEHELIETKPFERILADDSGHMILLGQPGAGKTTTMKCICHRLLHDNAFLVGGPSFPIVVRLRELNLAAAQGSFGTRLVFSEIARQLGLSFQAVYKANTPADVDESVATAQSVVLLFLDELRPLLIIDGFDEIASGSNRIAMVEEIRTLMRQLTHARVILTCRTGEFPYQIENASHFEICPLSGNQIREFAYKWLADNAKAEHFLSEVGHSPFADTAIKPLTLAHLCAIYERLGHIPEKPKTVYRKVVSLLIEDWDEQRSVRRPSRYAGFSPDRKFDFLCRLAFELVAAQRRGLFTVEDLKATYRRMCRDFELLPSEARQVLAELEGHTGLFVQAGFQSYEFVHNSLQEYLTAEYIKGLPSLPDSAELIARIPNELAIAVAISTNPSRYLTELVLTRLQDLNLPGPFFPTFINRLLQEKPEFNALDDVILALLVLYALYLEGAQVDGQQLQLILFDNLTSEFERLLAVLAQRNNRSTMLEYYRRTAMGVDAKGTPLVVLERTDLETTLRLPNRLFAREGFLEAETVWEQKHRSTSKKRLAARRDGKLRVRRRAAGQSDLFGEKA